jgi:hypothetical protein
MKKSEMAALIFLAVCVAGIFVSGCVNRGHHRCREAGRASDADNCTGYFRTPLDGTGKGVLVLCPQYRDLGQL